MSNKIKETQEKLKNLGYFASEDLSKIVLLFEASGKKDSKNIPTLLLQGKSGAGKTYLAETFSKMVGAEEKFVQCFPRMGTENFQYDVNIEGVMKQDADNSIKQGILLQALEQSKTAPVVLIIDELDKARPEVDSFLLDFLENGRLTTGTDTYQKGKYPIYTFITSNDKREIDEALLNRSKKVEVSRPSKELFLKILGLPETHYLGYIYDKCPDFSIRQAKQYLEDLEVLGTEIDEDALSQYINLDDLDVMSLADVQRVSEMENDGLEIELPNLKTCQVNLTNITGDDVPKWSNLLNDCAKNFDFESVKANSYSDEEDVYINIRSIDQLKKIEEYGISDKYYSGWFEYDMPEEEAESKNIIWAGNKRKNDGTRFGIKLKGNNLFKIAMNRGQTFVYLDEGNTLQQFLENEKDIDKDQEEFETDSNYKEYQKDEEDSNYVAYPGDE